jgi:uncharacterized BrkB/YihY/UPF0761 family membrane protein
MSDPAMEFRGEESGRGRTAERPTEIGLRGWRDVTARVKRDIKRDDVSLLAAGVAFYSLLALVPALVALVSVYGLIADPSVIRRNVDDVLAAAPTEVQELVRSQLSAIVESSPSGLRIGALVGVAVALWSASSGVKNLMTAINRAYHEEEGRGFLRLRGTAILLTVLLLVIGVAARIGLVIAGTDTNYSNEYEEHYNRHEVPSSRFSQDVITNATSSGKGRSTLLSLGSLVVRRSANTLTKAYTGVRNIRSLIQ